jgi:CheY-like chemotaxis protein
VDARVRAEEALREADRRKDEFLGMLSHELRNPLAPIRNSIYILKHADPTGPHARRAMAVIERQSEHLTRLVDDLLDVTRIARGKIELRRDRVDVVDLVRRAGEDHRSLLVDRGLELTVAVPEGRLWVDGDPTRLTQVIGNLLQNAAKFTMRDGRVTLEVAAEAGWTEIRVTDTGVGIDPGLLHQVFEPFVQAERSLARARGGLGLGLALVKGIIALHGGSVVAQSDGAGRGARLVARLPLAAPPPERVRRSDAPRAERRHRVLVVDDNVDAAESLAQLAEMFGHEVEVAYDGPSAIRKARAIHPTVILCDIGLPGMSGYDVARSLRNEPVLVQAQLIAVSGYAQPEDRKAAAEAGFDGHLAKPVDPVEVERLLS